MNNLAGDIFEDVVGNPLDNLEDLLSCNDWAFNRLNDDELTVQVEGKKGCYSLTFIWQDAFSAMQFFCEFDKKIPSEKMDQACRILRKINENLWMGHFDILSRNNAPCYRHTSLFRGFTQSAGNEQIEDLIDIALAESERYHNVFTLLQGANDISDEQLLFVLSDNAGEA
jgi:hypothetical protein